MAKKKKPKNRRIRSIEKFAEEQIEKYVKIHKEHEKDLRYIG